MLRLQNRNVSLVYCLSDDLRRQERIGVRVSSAEGRDLQLRNALGEVDLGGDYISSPQQLATLQQYEKLLSTKTFDAVIATTSAKQAVAQILQTFGLEFKPPARGDA